MGTQSTDIGSLPPEDLQRILQQAKSDRAQKLYMEPEAGRTMAKLVLAARDEVEIALKQANKFAKASGFGEADSLQSGIDAVNHYEHQVTALKTQLQALYDKLTQDINNFLAMEHIYTHCDELSAENIGKTLSGVQVTVTT